MSIFMADETFAIDITETKDEKGRTVYEIVEGGPYVLRTLKSREDSMLRNSEGDRKAFAALEILPSIVVAGLKKDDFPRLKSYIAEIMVMEAHRRSHLTEADRGN